MYRIAVDQIFIDSDEQLFGFLCNQGIVSVVTGIEDIVLLIKDNALYRCRADVKTNAQMLCRHRLAAFFLQGTQMDKIWLMTGITSAQSVTQRLLKL